MHDIWNPWHGCKKVSEGCAHCYMYYVDNLRGNDGGEIYSRPGLKVTKLLVFLPGSIVIESIKCFFKA